MFVKISLWKFSGSLIINLLLDIRNSKRRIQYGGQKFSKLFKFHKNWDMGVFWIADYGSAISFFKFKMAGPIGRPKIFTITEIS